MCWLHLRRCVAGLVVLIAGASLLVVSGVFVWSPINCWHEDIDIYSGRIRRTSYLLWCCVSDRVEETAISEALPPEDLRARHPEWKRVNTFSPGVHHSPHYIYHGAITDAKLLADIWERGRFTPAERRQSTHTLLAAWQSGDMGEVEPILAAAFDLAQIRDEASRSTD
jgi:hypothetical protein